MPPSPQRLIVGFKVVREEKVAYPSASLIADPFALPPIAWNRQNECSPSIPGRSHRDPTLVAAKVGVFDHFKTKDVAKKAQALVVARDKKGDGSETLKHGRYSVMWSSHFVI